MKCIISSSYGKGVLQWKMKVKSKVDMALQKILEGLEVLGCIPKSGQTHKPIFVRRYKGRKLWATKCKPRTKSQFKSKPNPGLGMR
jgi:hypothetical protein